MAAIEYPQKQNTWPGDYERGYRHGLEAAAKLIESGAAMADLIDDELLEAQARLIRDLSPHGT